MSNYINEAFKNPYKILNSIMSRATFVGKIIPDKIYLKIKYRAIFGKKLNLKNPKSFNEKLQWLKLYDRKSDYSKMVDKYEAKKYVSRIIGKDHIIPTLGVWDKFEEIDFSKLPKQFVLKCTHDSGGLVICRDKMSFDKYAAKEKIETCLKKNFYWQGREWPYKNVKPRILAEKYMEEENEDKEVDNNKKIKNDIKGLTDYKFFCFNGNPLFLYVSKGLENHATAEISFYDMNGNEENFHRSDFKPYHNAIMPLNFEKMKYFAGKIAENINCKFVRIDLYSINDKIFFSEITFTPCGGFLPFEPQSADEQLGKFIKL